MAALRRDVLSYDPYGRKTHAAYLEKTRPTEDIEVVQEKLTDILTDLQGPEVDRKVTSEEDNR